VSEVTEEKQQADVEAGSEIESVKKAPEVSVQQQETGITLGMVVSVAFVASAITAATMLVGYDHFLAKKVLSVDVKGFVEQQQELYLAGKITDEQLKQNYANLKTMVEQIPRNRVVLMGDAVLGGAEKLDVSITPAK